MDYLIALGVGLLAGLHTSTWGMYKDAPYEGFRWGKYFRSTIISAITAVVVVHLTDLQPAHAPHIVVLYAFTYVIERAMVEYWKTFLRVQDQSKFFIPMQFSVGGSVVQSSAVRLSAATGYLLGVVGVVYLVYYLQRIQFGAPGLVAVLSVGSLGGWISAFGGAWKDAPKEGFQLFKFFRSPALTLFYAFLLANFTHNYLFICFGALGLTIGTIETWKTFFFPSRPRGKFAGIKINFPEYLQKRQKFIPVFVAVWIFVIATTILALMGPHDGLL